MIKIKKLFFIFLFFIFLCSIGVNFSYALSNESIDFYSLGGDENVVLSYGDVYFDSNVLFDGDGSENNPFRYLNSSSLSSCSIAHLRSGVYNYDSDELIISSDLSFVGESPYNTFICNFKVNNSREGNNLSFVNVALINPQIESYGILDIKNSIFSNGSNSNIISHKSDNGAFNSQINILNSTFHGFSSQNSVECFAEM